MPTLVEIDGVGEIEFPDTMSVEDINAAIEKEILPQFQQPVRRAVPIEEAVVAPEAATTNLLPRFGAAVTENVTRAGQGLLRMAERVPVVQRVQQDLSVLGNPQLTPNEYLQGASRELGDIQANARSSYGVEAPDTFPEKLVEGVASLPPVVAAGPFATVVNAAMMGESQRQEAEAAGASPVAQELSFLAGGVTGAVSEAVLGVPALLRAGRAAGVTPTTIGSVARSVAGGASREGTQEGLEQGIGNVTAQQLYDPTRKLTEGVAESALLGAVIGAGAGPLIQAAGRQPEVVPALPDQPADLTETAALLEEPDEVVAPELPVSEPPPVITPSQQAAATVLGEDAIGLREQEAIQTGQPIPDFGTDVEEAITDAQEPQGDVLLPEEGRDTTQEVAGLSTLDSDTFQTLSDEPLREGWVGLQDPETLQAFQVPEGSTPEVIQNRLQEVRAEESAAYNRAREEQLERELVQERFDQNAKEVLAQMDEAPLMRKNLLTGDPAKELWMDRDRLKFVLDRQEANLKRAESGTLKEAGGSERVNPETLRPGVQALRDRLTELDATIPPAKEAVKKMKRPKKGEEGSTSIPQAVLEAGQSLYRKGIEFKDWSASMVKNLGAEIQPFLQQIWDGITAAVNRLSPTNRPEAGSVGGTGGRRPPPLPATPPPLPQQPVGIANARVDESRVRMGLPSAMQVARRSYGTVWDQAMALVSEDAQVADDLVAALAANPRPVSDLEDALLTYAAVMGETRFNQAVDAVNSASTDAELMDAETKLKRAQEYNQVLFDVTKSVGTETARGLAARRMRVNPDLTLARMQAETRAIANRGQPLSKEQEENIQKLHDQLQKQRERIIELEEKQAQYDAQTSFAALIKEIKGSQKEAIKKGRSVTEYLNDEAAKAKERLRGKLIRTSAGVDPTILWDLSIIGAAKIANGIKASTEWAAEMIQEFGEDIQPYLPEIFKQSQEFHEANQQAFNPPEETPATLLEEATDVLDPRLVFRMARAYVRQGMEGMESVLGQVHKDLQTKIPELTIREVRDAFSGYGKATYPSKEEDLVKLREMKVLARLTSQLEDVQRKVAPLRTGPQRDKLSVEARVLQKQVNDLMRKYGIQATSPKQQLQNSIQAVKTRLKNEIEELNLAIQNKTPRPNNRGVIEYDEEAKALLAERDRRRALYNEFFPKKGRTPDEVVKSTLKALDKAIAEETQMLREGILKRPPNAPGVSSPEIENKRMELDALRQLRRDLYAETQPRKSSEDMALEAALKSAKASIERMDQMLRSGNLDPAKRAQRFNPTTELEALWSERDAMRDALNELRRVQKPRTDPQERAAKQAIKALEKSIETLDQRLLSNDFTARPQKATRPDTKEVAQLRDIRDTMRQTFNELKKAQTPQRSPEEIRLSRDKKQIQNRIEKLHQKILAGDYAPTPKKPPVSDNEKLTLQAQYELIKNEYYKGLLEQKLKNRGVVKKAWDTTIEGLNTSRAILTSMDVSGVLRQGGFIAFGHPVRAAKSLPDMFKAFGNPFGSEYDAEVAYERVRQEIESRKNAPLYRAAKLYIAENAPNSLSKMEEAYASRWVAKIPRLLGGGLVRGSGRAYVTFLNKLRADTFDAMAAGLAVNGEPTLEEAKAIANYVNVATGRGTLGGQKMEAAGDLLNAFFFAPRYVASRFQLLAGQPFYGGNARTRKSIATEYARYLLGISAMVGLLLAWRDDDDPPLEKDPRSSDFLKVRFGDTRIDPFSGLLQSTVLASRVSTGKTKQDGKLVSLIPPLKYGQQNIPGVIGKFLRSKLAPWPGAALDYASREDMMGKPVDELSIAKKAFVPISFGEIGEVMQEQGIPKGTALMLLSLFGVGLQTYEKRQKKPKKDRESALTTTKF